MQRIPGLYYSNSDIQGRGVFTAQNIPEGTLIEICPVIVIPQTEVDTIHQTELHDYYFVWGEHDEMAAIALGYGSLYNHALLPNADFVLDLNQKVIEFTAIKEIAPGDEITINYHGEYGCDDELWFDQSGRRTQRIKFR